MHEFDTYINTIIDGLNISKEKKEELAEEFKDHLESLKSEFIKNGYSDGESIKSAMERFGESRDIKKKLHKSLFSFRSSVKLLFGLFITLISIIFSYLPIAGVAIAFRKYSSAVHHVYALFFAHRWGIICWILLFIPVGYFLPIILKRVNKLALTFSAISILIGVCFNIALTNSINVAFLFTCFASGLLGEVAGYVMLIAVNKLTMVHKNERLT